MSAVTEEVTLEGIDLDKAPPCELRWYFGEGERRPCGKPSAYRVRLNFECGSESVRFVCARCYADHVVRREVGCRPHDCEHALTCWSLT